MGVGGAWVTRAGLQVAAMTKKPKPLDEHKEHAIALAVYRVCIVVLLLMVVFKVYDIDDMNRAANAAEALFNIIIMAAGFAIFVLLCTEYSNHD